MNILIIGGNSGLGLEIGKLLSQGKEQVYVTGRVFGDLPPKLTFLELNITENLVQLKHDLDGMMRELPSIDLLVYAAGFLKKGHISELPDEYIETMVHVGLTAPALLIQRILKKQGSLPGFIAITSTSQWRPRELEPVYAAVKAGLGMFAESASLDPQIKKTLVVGPAGMNTKFREEGEKERGGLLSPESTARQILELWKGDYAYRLARLLREPVPEAERVQILETRV